MKDDFKIITELAINELNEEIKKYFARCEFERDVIWGYLEDFKTISNYYKDNYKGKQYGQRSKRLKLVKFILEELQELFDSYGIVHTMANSLEEEE